MMMHNKDHRAPSGKLELSYAHSESGNEHRDEYEMARLLVENGQIVLEESVRSTNVYDLSDSTRKQRYAISVDSLIDLIKKNGDEVP